LKVGRLFFFAYKTYNGAFRGALPQTKKLSPGLSKSEVHRYFYVLERERERVGARVRVRKRNGKGKGKKN
jgi:hypothetical protein